MEQRNFQLLYSEKLEVWSTRLEDEKQLVSKPLFQTYEGLRSYRH